VREPSLVPSRLAAAIGIAESARRTAREAVEEWLDGKRALLVMDNFEQVLDAGSLVADLLRVSPTLKVLATSRAPLQVSGEHEYPVPGLPTPPDVSQMTALELARLPAADRGVDVATLATYEAVRLFIARATAVKPGFLVTNDNAAAVAAICARLHGMPLAIELAAARIKLLGPDAILARLEHQLNLLAAGSRDLPERQQTLRGAITWSYDILDAPSRLLLDRLSVFAGDIELEAAAAVCGPAVELGMDPVEGVLGLANQSLVRTIEDPSEPRFEMLATIREFAAEMLALRGQGDELERRHGAWFLAFANEAAGQLNGDDQRAWLERFEHAHDNLRAAMDRAAAREDGEIAIGVAFSCWRFWQKRGHLYEARRRLDAMATTEWSRRDPILRARLMEAVGGVSWWQGDINGMGPAYREAAELWRTLGDRRELANALYNYSFVFTVPTDPDPKNYESDPTGEGIDILNEALSIFRELGDDRGEANVLWGIGNMQYFRNQIDPGSEVMRLALEKFRKVGDRTMEAWTLHMLGGALLRHGRVDESRAALREAMRTFYDASDTAGITLSLDDLSAQAVADGDVERAARMWGAARNLAATTGAQLASFVDAAIEFENRPNVQKDLGPERLKELAAEGAAMGLDEIVGYALGVSVESLRDGGAG
jgi:predicted ATPase